VVLNSAWQPDRHDSVAGRWSLSSALASAPLALIVAGPAIVAHIGGRTLNVYASQVAVAILIIHMALTSLAQTNRSVLPREMRWLLGASALLALPLLWSTDFAAGAVAYLNFASGTIGGLAIARIWSNFRSGYSWIDAGYVLFLLVGVAQLVLSLSKATSVTALHQSSQTPWGNSNFVAGCLVVGSMAVIGRAVSMGRYRKSLIMVSVIAICVAMLTLSRGAVIASCVGAVILAWTASGRLQRRHHEVPHTNIGAARQRASVQLLFRVLACLIPITALLAINHVTALRAQVNSQVYSNVDTRLALYQLAWQEFVREPLTGTGWASLRQASLLFAGESQTFAHNSVLSLLQIGGALSLPYLAIVSLLSFRAIRFGGPYGAAVGASIAVSMTDPFFESVTGNLLFIPIAFIASLSCSTSPQTAKTVGKSLPHEKEEILYFPAHRT